MLSFIPLYLFLHMDSCSQYFSLKSPSPCPLLSLSDRSCIFFIRLQFPFLSIHHAHPSQLASYPPHFFFFLYNYPPAEITSSPKISFVFSPNAPIFPLLQRLVLFNFFCPGVPFALPSSTFYPHFSHPRFSFLPSPFSPLCLPCLFSPYL